MLMIIHINNIMYAKRIYATNNPQKSQTVNSQAQFSSPAFFEEIFNNGTSDYQKFLDLKNFWI